MAIANQITSNTPYNAEDLTAAYKAVYGGLPASMIDPRTGKLYPGYGQSIFPGSVIDTPGGQKIDASQLMYMYQQAGGGQGGTGAGGQGGTAGAGGQPMPMGANGQPMPMGANGQLMPQGQGGSYLGPSNQFSSGTTNMADITQQGGSSVLYNTSGQPISPAQTAEIMRLYSAYEQGDMQAGAAATQWGRALGIDLDGAVNNMRQGIGPNAPAANAASQNQPETNALAQMRQIDPASEALRTGVSQSYLTSLQQAQNPSAAQFQSYLDLYKQLDPQGYQQRANMTKQVSDYVTQVTGQAPTSAADALAKYKQLDPQGYASMTALNAGMDSYLKQAQAEAALGSQLDPVTARQVEQQARAGQAARGNVYGTPQMVSEAMGMGQAGEARKQQRQAALSQALGQQQGYLTSGATTGAVGNQLYQAGLGNRATALGLQQGYLGSGLDLGSTAMNLYSQNQQNLRNAQGGALNYLSSGQTPYQAGASYMDRANANAANAAQGGPVYQPVSLGAGNLGTAQQAPQYGLDVGAQSQNYFNSLNNAYGGGGGGAQKNRGVSAATGAATGAISGAAAGSVVPVYGTAIGAVVGGVAGGLGGYYS